MSVQQFIIHMIPIKLQRQRVRLTESVLIARQYDKRSSYLCAVFKSLIACSKLRVGVGGIGMFLVLYLLLQRQRTWAGPPKNLVVNGSNEECKILCYARCIQNEYL